MHLPEFMQCYMAINKLFARVMNKAEGSRIVGARSSPGGGTLRISGCGCAARTLEPLAYTRASFSWILLPYTRVNSWFPWSSQPTGQFC